MQRARNFRNAILAATCLTVMGQAAWAAQPRYKVVVPPLSVAPGGLSEASAINDRGLTALQLYASNGFEDAYRCTGTVCKQIPSLGDNSFPDSVLADAINDAGQIVGSSSRHDYRHAYLFDGRTTKDLGTFDEGKCGGCELASYAHGINNVGRIVGTGTTADQTFRGFVWENGTMTKIGTFGGKHSYANAVNDSGDVVGAASTPDEQLHAYLYAGPKMRDLGTLGGTYSEALAVNQWRHVVGCSATAGNAAQVAFVSYSGGVMQALKTLGGSSACAYGINRAGWIVGTSTLTPGQQDYHGFVFDGDEVYDLNDTLGDDDRATWVVTGGRGINKNAQIVVNAKNRINGAERALVLTLITP